jgi:hypothetical protein
VQQQQQQWRQLRQQQQDWGWQPELSQQCLAHVQLETLNQQQTKENVAQTEETFVGAVLGWAEKEPGCSKGVAQDGEGAHHLKMTWEAIAMGTG